MTVTDSIEKDNDKIWYKKRRVQIACGIMIVAILSVIITTKANQNNFNMNQSIPLYMQTAAVKKNQTTGDGDIDIVSETINTDSMVTIYLENAGRSDPFLPSSNYELTVTDLSDDYLTPPPENAGYDTDAINIVKTKVSGIMYDNYNPTAILNIEGSDYLVKSGDTINSYKILAISPSTVTVQLGANTFKAGVGQMFSGDDMNYVNDSFGSERRINF